MQSVDTDGQSANVDPFSAPANHRLVCETCGAEAFLPVDLATQGLTFQCCLIGRACGVAPILSGNAGFRDIAPIGFPAAQTLPLSGESPAQANFLFGQAPSLGQNVSSAVNMAVPSDDE